jgi:hypothetical protein
VIAISFRLYQFCLTNVVFIESPSAGSEGLRNQKRQTEAACR